MARSDFYKLVGMKIVPCSLEEWGEWMQRKPKERHIERSFFFEPDETRVMVSTVFLGMDHGFGPLPGEDEDPLPPLLFETMVFGGWQDETQVRSYTLGEAKSVHYDLCKLIKVSGAVESTEEEYNDGKKKA